MTQIKIINLIVWLLLVIGIVVFVNIKTDNSLASIYEIFNPCDSKNINNCSEEDLKNLIRESLK